MKWKNPDRLTCCIIMLVIFHTVMVYLGIFCKRFAEGDIRDLLIQCDLIA